MQNEKNNKGCKVLLKKKKEKKRGKFMSNPSDTENLPEENTKRL